MAGQSFSRIRAGRAAAWVRPHASLLRWALMVATAFGFLALDRPTPSGLLALVVFAVVVLATIGLLGGGAASADVPPQPGGDADRGEAAADTRSAHPVR